MSRNTKGNNLNNVSDGQFQTVTPHGSSGEDPYGNVTMDDLTKHIGDKDTRQMVHKWVTHFPDAFHIVSHGNHAMARIKDDGQVTIPSTPHKGRSGLKNTEGDIKRGLREAGHDVSKIAKGGNPKGKKGKKGKQRSDDENL